VSGDVVVWGGNVSFSPGGSVAGDLLVFGGTIEAPPGGALPVEGRVATPVSLLNVYLAEMQRAPWEASRAGASILGGLHLMALSAWLAVALAVLYFFSSPLSRAAMSAENDWTGALAAGVLGVLTLFLTAGAALSLLPSAVAIPIALASAAVAVGAKVFGMAALFLLVGQRILKSVAPARRPAAVAAGFVLLGGLSLVPMLGAVVWSAASIVAVGVALFGVQITGPWALTVVFVSLGAVTFLALGYVIASFAKTEDSANGMTSIVQFPMMFLSGTFFPIESMPAPLQTVARAIPLTYLADALRQVMVGGAAFASLGVCAAVLTGWLVVCFAIASRKFQWQ